MGEAGRRKHREWLRTKTNPNARTVRRGRTAKADARGAATAKADVPGAAPARAAAGKGARADAAKAGGINSAAGGQKVRPRSISTSWSETASISTIRRT